MTINYIVVIISLISCRRRRGIRRDTLMRRRRQNRRAVSEILKRRHGLEYPMKLAEGGGVQVERGSLLPELNLAMSHRRRLLLVLTSPRGVASGKCGLGLEGEYDRLGHFLTPRASCEGVARAMCQDGDVGTCEGRRRKAVELQRYGAGASDGKGLGHHLADEAEAFHVGARLEARSPAASWQI